MPIKTLRLQHGFIIYWADEIQAVREMLELAYG
jgi:hypothetical protein